MWDPINEKRNKIIPHQWKSPPPRTGVLLKGWAMTCWLHKQHAYESALSVFIYDTTHSPTTHSLTLNTGIPCAGCVCQQIFNYQDHSGSCHLRANSLSENWCPPIVRLSLILHRQGSSKLRKTESWTLGGSLRTVGFICSPYKAR